jgi:hypothetical protein
MVSFGEPDSISSEIGDVCRIRAEAGPAPELHVDRPWNVVSAGVRFLRLYENHTTDARNDSNKANR